MIRPLCVSVWFAVLLQESTCEPDSHEVMLVSDENGAFGGLPKDPATDDWMDEKRHFFAEGDMVFIPSDDPNDLLIIHHDTDSNRRLALEHPLLTKQSNAGTAGRDGQSELVWWWWRRRKTSAPTPAPTTMPSSMPSKAPTVFDRAFKSKRDNVWDVLSTFDSFKTKETLWDLSGDRPVLSRGHYAVLPTWWADQVQDETTEKDPEQIRGTMNIMRDYYLDMSWGLHDVTFDLFNQTVIPDMTSTNVTFGGTKKSAAKILEDAGYVQDLNYTAIYVIYHVVSGTGPGGGGLAYVNGNYFWSSYPTRLAVNRHEVGHNYGKASPCYPHVWQVAIRAFARLSSSTLLRLTQ